MRSHWERIAWLTLLLIIAVAVVWLTVRIELTFWTFGLAPDSDDAAFGAEVDIHGLVVREVVLVEAVGREEPRLTLAAGTWRATVETADVGIDWAQIAVAGPRRNTIGWDISNSRSAVFVVSYRPPSRDTPGTLNGREFRIRTNAIDDHPWSVTLERLGDPMETLIDRKAP
ncbi:MAG: hypothetical protein OXG43_11140 [Chloroflexi bacterium]|nr:hypothetical protein [Chloroflexota bacterium]